MPYKPLWASLALVALLLAAAPGSLSAKSNVDALDVARTYVDENAAQLGVTRADVKDLVGRDLAEDIVGRPVYAEENAYEFLAMLDALVALEDWDALNAYLPRARAFSDALSLVEPASDRAAGIVSAAAGDPATAEECLTRALKRFEELGVVFDAALTKERLAAVLPNGQATRLLREALATYKQLDAAPHAERLQAASRPVARPRLRQT